MTTQNGAKARENDRKTKQSRGETQQESRLLAKIFGSWSFEEDLVWHVSAATSLSQSRALLSNSNLTSQICTNKERASCFRGVAPGNSNELVRGVVTRQNDPRPRRPAFARLDAGNGRRKVRCCGVLLRSACDPLSFAGGRRRVVSLDFATLAANEAATDRDR
jgi:hypothetical protein